MVYNHKMSNYSNNVYHAPLEKPKRTSHNHDVKRLATGFGSNLHGDNTSRQPVQTRGGKSVVNVVICKYSNWTWTKDLTSIKETVDRLRYITTRELKKVTKVFRSDQGGEYMNYGLDELLEEIRVVHETSTTSISQQNGTAENVFKTS